MPRAKLHFGLELSTHSYNLEDMLRVIDRTLTVSARVNVLARSAWDFTARNLEGKIEISAGTRILARKRFARRTTETTGKFESRDAFQECIRVIWAGTRSNYLDRSGDRGRSAPPTKCSSEERLFRGAKISGGTFSSPVDYRRTYTGCVITCETYFRSGYPKAVETIDDTNMCLIWPRFRVTVISVMYNCFCPRRKCLKYASSVWVQVSSRVVACQFLKDSRYLSDSIITTALNVEIIRRHARQVCQQIRQIPGMFEKLWKTAWRDDCRLVFGPKVHILSIYF